MKNPKFKIGQVVCNRSYKDDYFRIVERHYFEDSKEWIYMRVKNAIGGFDEKSLRALTFREKAMRGRVCKKCRKPSATLYGGYCGNCERSR